MLDWNSIAVFQLDKEWAFSAPLQSNGIKFQSQILFPTLNTNQLFYGTKGLLALAYFVDNTLSDPLFYYPAEIIYPWISDCQIIIFPSFSLPGVYRLATKISSGNFQGNTWSLECWEYTAVSQTQSLFTTQTPSSPNASDGSGSDGDYELGIKFYSTKAGRITAIRHWKAPSETGSHVGRIWSSSGQLLASVNFTNETASGWQQQALDIPLIIGANTTYVVSVNVNSYFAFTLNGLATTVTNGDLSAVADGSNGVYNANPGSFPDQTFNNNANYFRDIVFTPYLLSR